MDKEYSYLAEPPYQLRLSFDDDGRITEKHEYIAGREKPISRYYTYTGGKLQIVKDNPSNPIALEMYQYNNYGQLVETYKWHTRSKMDSANIHGLPIDFMFNEDDDINPKWMQYGNDFYDLYYDHVVSPLTAGYSSPCGC